MGSDVKHSPPLDGRAERWREHRIARRVHLVDSAMTAFERHGPDANLQQIAQVAGMPKPKIYRHFDDKADLITAVGQRMRDLILEQMAVALRPDLTVRECLRQCLNAYFSVVTAYPNTARMLTASPPPGRGRANAITENGRAVAKVLIAITNKDLARAHVETDGVEPLTHAIVGSVLSASDWWMMQKAEDRMPVERLVEHLTTLLLGAAQASLRALDLDLDPDAVIRAEQLQDLTPR
jgi:AcrR family transcriptional regulator